ncbi:MAG TPA: hypothetical protein DCZ91_24380 [Lachnospiraceae bacterium]|nr:hypothetical protein [Lachnospiraceae bacterium]
MKSKVLCWHKILCRPSLLCTALAALLFFGDAATVRAEDYKGGDWGVQFTGEGMESNFSSADISDAVYSLQPGDSVAISLGLENRSGQVSEWYMTNRVLSSLEDHSDEARGGAYAYRLAYTGQDGQETVFFDSATIGGDRSSAAGLGLHEAVEGMGEYFRLGTLAPGEKGTVTLSVALDGETQGNDYQNTLADLSMNFAVDTLNPTGDDGGGEPEPGKSYTTGGPKTGDSNSLALWSCIAFGSGVLLLVLALLGMKKGRREEAS